MNNSISTEERIDNYLLGRMTKEERYLFEQDLESNEELREDFECQKTIANAVQKVAMKDFLAQYSSQRHKEKDNKAIWRENLDSFWIHLKEFFGSGQRVAWTIVSVAAMVVLIVGGINYSSTRRALLTNGTLSFSELSTPIVRGGNPLDSLISVAYQLIDKNDLKGAMVVVEEAKSIAKEGLARPVSSEEEEYEYNLRKQQLYELDWYEAIILMNDGKIIKAKKALENIASSGNPYAENARNILKDIF